MSHEFNRGFIEVTEIGTGDWDTTAGLQTISDTIKAELDGIAQLGFSASSILSMRNNANVRTIYIRICGITINGKEIFTNTEKNNIYSTIKTTLEALDEITSLASDMKIRGGLTYLFS